MSPYIRPPALTRPDRHLSLSVAALLFAVYIATFTGLPDTLRAEIGFQTTHGLAASGAPRIAGTPEADGLAILFAEGGARVPVLRQGRDGALFSAAPIGNALCGVPLYVVGHLVSFTAPWIAERHARAEYGELAGSEYFEHLFVGIRAPLLSALAGALLVLISRRLGASPMAAWIGALAYGLTTFAWAQARSHSGEVTATFLLLVAFHEILSLEEGFDRLVRPYVLRLSAIGVALGGAAVTTLTTLPAVLLLDVVLVAILRRGCGRLSSWRASAGHRRIPTFAEAAAWIVLPQLVLLGGLAALDVWRFGSPWTSLEESFDLRDARALSRVAALTFSPGRGLFLMAPGLLLLLFGWDRARRVGDRIVSGALFGLVITLFASALVARRGHESSYGPVELLPLLPFLWIGVALALGSGARPGVWWTAAGLFGLGLVVQIGAAAVDHTTHHSLAAEAVVLLEDGEDTSLEHRVAWDPGFAAPWAHWRILRRRVATVSRPEWQEAFPAWEIFRVDGEALLVPRTVRETRFHHLAWWDLKTRLEGPLLPAVAFVGVLLVAGWSLAGRGLGPRRARVQPWERSGR